MAPVILHVYDLSDHNGWMQCAGIGIFHSGVEGAFFCQSTACCGRRSCEVSLVVPTKRQEGTVSTANKAKRALSKLSTAHMWRSASCHHLVCQRSGLSVSVTLTGQQQRNLIWQEMFAVYGSEYAFGAHELDSPGVFATLPRQAPGEATLRTSIHIGETSYSAKAVHQIVSNMGQHYWGSRYHLLQMNCNHFSSDLCYELCGQRPPGWINRLAGVVVGLHCLIPVDWVPPLDTPSAPPSFAVTESPRALAAQIASAQRANQYAVASDAHAPGNSERQRLLGSSRSSSFAQMEDSVSKRGSQ